MTTASASVFLMRAMQKSMRKILWNQVKWIGSGRRDSTPVFGKSMMMRRSGLWRNEKLPRLPGDPVGFDIARRSPAGQLAEMCEQIGAGTGAK
ncbi:unnamed protein product [Symbiodinium sp. CCMP2456]|nr:unnamed protein product [Symbiodinium sp. CCMP2456]